MGQYILFHELPEHLKKTHEINTKYMITKYDDPNFYWIGKFKVDRKENNYILGEIQNPRDRKI